MTFHPDEQAQQEDNSDLPPLEESDDEDELADTVHVIDPQQPRAVMTIPITITFTSNGGNNIPTIASMQQLATDLAMRPSQLIRSIGGQVLPQAGGLVLPQSPN